VVTDDIGTRYGIEFDDEQEKMADLENIKKIASEVAEIPQVEYKV
jgi:hypothetical protein